MIPLPPAIERLEIDLLNRKITGYEASREVFSIRKKLGPPWHWKSWKIARKKILGTECKTCGAGPDAILYLQHTVKNPRVQPYINAAKERLNAMEPEKDWRPGLKAQIYEIRDAVIPGARDWCPICESLSIQFRKGAVNWICNSKAGGRLCGYVFTEPRQKMALTAAQKKTIRKHKYQAYKDIILHREHDVFRQAMLDWIEDWRQYLSLKYTKTLCKSCAYVEDMLD